MKTLPVEYLKECFDYDPDAGVLLWRERPRAHFNTDQAWLSSRTQIAGKVVAAHHAKGKYAYVMVDKTPYLVHRVCFAIYHGYWPDEVDHRNGNTRDNRIENLRAATRQQNSFNTTLHGTNANGLKGVSYKPGAKRPWYGRVTISGTCYRTPYFSTPKEAAAAYQDLVERHHGEYGLLSSRTSTC
jgi:hypothetical protein